MHSRINDDVVRSTIDQVYEAAIDSSRWYDTVRNLCTIFEGSRTCFAKFDRQIGSFEHVSTEIDPESVRQLKQFKRNIMLETACEAPIGLVYNDQSTIGRQKLQRSAFWNDWARPRDMYGSMTCKIHVEESSFWFLDLQRGRNSPGFDEADIRLLKRLIPHILRAGRLSKMFQARQSLASVFQQLPFGLFIVDCDRTVLASNRVAEAMLAAGGGGLRIRSNRLTVADASDDERLGALIARTCAPDAKGFRDPGDDMLLWAEGGEGEQISYALSVGPLNSTTMFGTSFQSCSAIFVKEVRLLLPEKCEAFLQSSFDLSRSEARLAMELASGKSLKEISAESGIQMNTARTYLDRIFRKTETHQQSQLVALLRSAVPYGLVNWQA